MCQTNYPVSLADVLQSEGGFNNDPQDAGGATNKGITQREYDRWRIRHGYAPRSVKLIEDWEVSAIYKEDYWNAVSGDALPVGVDYCVFDFGVNSGPSRAAHALQTALGVAADGIIGPGTLRAAQMADPCKLIGAICDERLAYLAQLSNFGHFGDGWDNRVHEVEQRANAMVAA